MRSLIEALEALRYLHDENGVPLTTQPAPAVLVARINFQPAGSTPHDFLADTGLAFGKRSSGLQYGWSRSMTAAAYARTGSRMPEARYDTFIASQQGGNANWDIAVPNGKYTVRVVGGDPKSPSSTLKIAAEGVLVINGVSNTTTPFREGVATVTVSDGKLTLSNAAGASNNKINFVEIMRGVDALPTVRVSTTADPASEAGAAGNFRITRSGPLDEELVINFRTSGDAKNGVDYQTLSGVTEIATGQTFVDVPLNAIADGITESTESASLYLVYSAGTTTDTKSFASIRILDAKVTPTPPTPVPPNPVPPTPVPPTPTDPTPTPPDPTPTPIPPTPDPTPTPTPIGTLHWTRGADAPTASAEAMTAVVAGRLYRFGGFYDSTFNQTTRADYYDPKANKWTRVADMPKAITHAGVVVIGTDIYVIGGYTQSPGNSAGGSKTFGVRDVLIYHTANNTWGTGTSLPAARASGSAAVIGRTIYYAGGESGGRAVDAAELFEFDLDNAAAGWVQKKSMPEAKNHFGMAAIDGKLYVVGGQKSFDSTAAYLSSAYRYDPATDTWMTIASMGTKTSHITNSTFELAGKLIAIGGETVGRVRVSNVNQYDPATNTWTSLTSLPGPRLSPAAALIDGKLYVAGGSSGPQEKTLFIGAIA